MLQKNLLLCCGLPGWECVPQGFVEKLRGVCSPTGLNRVNAFQGGQQAKSSHENKTHIPRRRNSRRFRLFHYRRRSRLGLLSGNSAQGQRACHVSISIVLQNTQRHRANASFKGAALMDGPLARSDSDDLAS